MFERYTEKARRALFFARYEASEFGSHHIEPEHILLGLFREDNALANRYLQSCPGTESIRKQVEAHAPARAKIPGTVDLPLSHECKHLLDRVADEARRLSHDHIDTGHLLLGLLCEEKCFAAELLHERGLSISQMRKDLEDGGSYV